MASNTAWKTRGMMTSTTGKARGERTKCMVKYSTTVDKTTGPSLMSWSLWNRFSQDWKVSICRRQGKVCAFLYDTAYH